MMIDNNILKWEGQVYTGISNINYDTQAWIIVDKTFYHKMNYLLICNIWTLGALPEV